jgi:pimeloyl-ACP methyl ester carboxylesterase
MKTTQTKPSIVFCHGLWADGSCFNKVIPALQAEGHQVIAAQYGLDTTADDVATVRRTLGRVSSPAILVGHSYSGSVITGAGTDDRVAGLVYIAALAPDADETSQTQQSNFPKTASSPTSKSRTDVSGCFRKASSVSQAICPSRKRSSFWRPTSRRLPTCSTRKSEELLGDRSQAGTSSPRTTVPSMPTCNSSLLSGWAPPRRRSPAATFPCSRNPTW